MLLDINNIGVNKEAYSKLRELGFSLEDRIDIKNLSTDKNGLDPDVDCFVVGRLTEFNQYLTSSDPKIGAEYFSRVDINNGNSKELIEGVRFEPDGGLCVVYCSLRKVNEGIIPIHAIVDFSETQHGAYEEARAKLQDIKNALKVHLQGQFHNVDVTGENPENGVIAFDLTKEQLKEVNKIYTQAIQHCFDFLKSYGFR